MNGRKLRNYMKLLCENKFITVESVLAGHPDKVCDQICDAILDDYIAKDNKANVAVECLGTGNNLFIGGELYSNVDVNVSKIAQDVYKKIGYTDELNIIEKLNIQSSQLRLGIKNQGSGDQGIMYGFACKSEYNYLPFSVYAINSIAKEIDLLRKKTNFFLPDGKVQMTFNNNVVESLVINVQHRKNTDLDDLKELIINEAIRKVINVEEIQKIYFNGSSSFINGGFSNDTGLSGRKIISDTYCGLAPHGGGAFSGKDPTKMDRSAAYMARFVAKNIVANEICNYCNVAVAYAFAEEKPLMISVETENPQKTKLAQKVINEKFDFRPNAIIDRLELRKEKYEPTATYGHFTNPKYKWEKIINI